ncbi:ArsR/SmtB family transcription factor [Streptomyces sp. NPDC127108]|uniref:ArsR/SmtB family transcription factor n=1 Tax=Streptomyces sp. NPDC127108 TaxID=3345361 RepID=UPI0036425978
MSANTADGTERGRPGSRDAHGAQATEVFAALVDPTRRKLLDTLAETDGASASALAHRLPVSRQAIVKHLHVLQAAGLITPEREGRAVVYRVRAAPLEASACWMTELAAVWDRRLAAIKQVAEAAEAQPKEDSPDA